MFLLAALELRDWLLITQIAIYVLVSLPAWVALYLLSRQVQTNSDALSLNAMAIRHQLFVSLTDNLSTDIHDTMMLHACDQFDPSVFAERYKNQPQRIRSYLLMKRKYLYLVFSSLVEKGFPVSETTIAELWIRELGEFHEFHDVHGRQGRYYPEFSTFIARTLGTTTPSKWMCEAHGA